jgi:hypothetical protein
MRMPFFACGVARNGQQTANRGLPNFQVAEILSSK